jgi:phosphohistidine phosphatase
MRVILFRHGIAISREDSACPPDPERELTDLGRVETRRAAEGLLDLGISPDLIVTSDYARAIQTARIAAEVLHVEEQENVVRTGDVAPTVDPRRFLELLDRMPCREMLVVGHNPHLSGLLSLLVGAPRQPFTWMKKAGAALVDLGLDARPPGRLVWLLEPEILGRLADSR